MRNWTHPRTITGGTAEGNRYFPRTSIEEAMWREIDKGNHIRFNAPRRSGKTSVMKAIAKNPPSGYRCIYQNISSDDTAQEFYARLLHLLLKELSGIQAFKAKFTHWITEHGISEVGTTGLKISQKDGDNKQRFLALLPELKETDIKIVLLLDEFPDVIHGITQREGSEAARDVLQTLRSLTHNDDFKGHFTLVLAGSIGLDHIVKKVDRTVVINVYRKIDVTPLGEDEPNEFISFLLKGATLQMNRDTRDYLIKKLNRPLPYFIQLIIEQCNDMLHKEGRPNLEPSDIDKAWDYLLTQHEHFDDWDYRLRAFFAEDYPFYVEILSKCAHNSSLSIQEAYDIGLKYGNDITYKAKIDDVLINDGYLLQEGNSLKFISPLLQDWWKNRHPLIDPKL